MSTTCDHFSPPNGDTFQAGTGRGPEKDSDKVQGSTISVPEPGCSSGTNSQPGAVEEPSERSRQTVIRLKRRIDDSPTKVLVVSFKRSKLESGDVTTGACSTSAIERGDDGEEGGPLCSQVLRLVGTVAADEEDNNNIKMTIRNALESSKGTLSRPDAKVEFRRSVKVGCSKITEKVRKRFSRSSEDNRFRLISSKRGIVVPESDGENPDGWREEGEKDLLKMLDLVPEDKLEVPKKRERPEGYEPGNVTCNGIPMMKEKRLQREDEKGYVYDLYLANDLPTEDLLYSSQIVRVEEADELDMGEYRDRAEEDHFMEDDEDSNAEDNYRNDYPDSEEEGLRDESDSEARGNECYRYEDGGFSDDDGHRHFKGLTMGGDSSSEEDLIYGIEDDGGNFGMDFDQRYARYKRRVQNEYADEVVSVSSDDEDLD